MLIAKIFGKRIAVAGVVDQGIRELALAHESAATRLEMDLPQYSFATCPIDFLCCVESPACVWAGWGFVTWIMLMVGAGVIGTILLRDQR